MSTSRNIQHIHGYYSPDDLFGKIIEGLDKLGKDLANVTLDDLQPVDEFHIRGDTATRELIRLAEFTPDTVSYTHLTLPTSDLG